MTSKTLEALQKLKVDCLYKKATHAIAARRILKEAKNFKIYLIIGSALASISVIMNIGVWESLKTSENNNCILTIQIIVNAVGAIGALFVLYASSFSDYYTKMEQANKHEAVSAELNHTYKKIRNIEAEYLDAKMNESMLAEHLKVLTDEFIMKTQGVPITDDCDFEKAREQYKKGYLTDYSDKELNS